MTTNAYEDDRGRVAVAAKALNGITTADTSAAVNALSSLDTAILDAEPLPMLAGLFTVGSKPAPGVPNIMCNAYWNKLVGKDGTLLSNNAIDQFLAAGIPGCVRIFMGRYAPAGYAFNSITMNDQGVIAACPVWWNTKYMAAVQQLVTQLRKYDGQVSAFFIGDPMTIYDEPFQRQIQDVATRHNLLAAGYSTALDKQSFAAMLDTWSGFKKTRIGLAFNPYQYVQADGTGQTDVSFTTEFMDSCVSRYGQRFIIQNNSIRDPISKLGNAYAAMYACMQELAGKGQPLGFQTATAARIGSYPNTIEWAIEQGACRLEIQTGFQTVLTPTQLAMYDKQLKANAPS